MSSISQDDGSSVRTGVSGRPRSRRSIDRVKGNTSSSSGSGSGGGTSGSSGDSQTSVVEKIHEFVPMSSELLDHYKAALTEMEEERDTYIRAFDDCIDNARGVHKLHWELRQRNKEVRGMR